jgi:hypothetical protein
MEAPGARPEPADPPSERRRFDAQDRGGLIVAEPVPGDEQQRLTMLLIDLASRSRASRRVSTVSAESVAYAATRSSIAIRSSSARLLRLARARFEMTLRAVTKSQARGGGEGMSSQRRQAIMNVSAAMSWAASAPT